MAAAARRLRGPVRVRRQTSRARRCRMRPGSTTSGPNGRSARPSRPRPRRSPGGPMRRGPSAKARCERFRAHRPTRPRRPGWSARGPARSEPRGRSLQAVRAAGIREGDRVESCRRSAGRSCRTSHAGHPGLRRRMVAGGTDPSTVRTPSCRSARSFVARSFAATWPSTHATASRYRQYAAGASVRLTRGGKPADRRAARTGSGAWATALSAACAREVRCAPS